MGGTTGGSTEGASPRSSAKPAPRRPPPFQVLIDFDGTLVEPNVAIELVAEFVEDGARIAKEVDVQLHAGEITLREAWGREVALLPMERCDEMARYAVEHVPLRKGARELLELLSTQEVPVAVVSGGLDFYIHPILQREDLDVPVFSDRVEAGSNGGPFQLKHPFGHPTCQLCGICKARVVRDHAGTQVPVVFVGDGSTDRYAAEVADVVFARHRLLTYCRERGVPCLPFEDLHPVRDQLERWMTGTGPVPRRVKLGLEGSVCPISRHLSNNEG